MLDNLLATALDAAPTGSTIRLHATDTDTDDTVELHGVDQGPGLTAAGRSAAGLDAVIRLPGA